MEKEEWKLKRVKRFIIQINPQEITSHKNLIYDGRIAVTAVGKRDLSDILERWLKYEIEPIPWIKNGQKKYKFGLKSIYYN